MENLMSPKAMQMVHDALKPIIEKGRHLQRIKMVVCPTSRIAVTSSIQTKYGTLRIETDIYVPPGLSYLIEDPGSVGRAFAWVSRRKQI